MKLLSHIITLSVLLIGNITNANATDIQFSKETFTFNNISLPYRKANIVGTGEKATLLVYLHGGTSKGNNNESQLQESGISDICNFLQQQGQKAIFIVPQCPTDKSWLGPMLSAVHALLDQYITQGVADASKVYCFGGSMGGTGTWNMIATYPEMFAAAMPVAGNPTGLNAENVAKVPLFTVMGTADRIMSIPAVEAFLKLMDTYNPDYRFETEQGWSHEDTCKKSYTAERLNWVINHTKDSSGITTIIPDNIEIVSTKWYDITGKTYSSQPSQNGIFIRCVSYNNGSQITEKVTIMH